MEKYSAYSEETQQVSNPINESLSNAFTNNPFNNNFSNYYYNFNQNYLQNYNLMQSFSSSYAPTQSYLPTASADYYPAQMTSSPASNKQILNQDKTNPSTPPASNVKTSIYPTPPSDKDSLNKTDSTEPNSPDVSQAKDILNSEESDISSTVKKEASGRCKRRSRTQFSKQQIDCLEAVFQKSHYPEVHVVDRISEKLGLSIERICVWFQNRRAKFKKTKKPSSTHSESNLGKNDFYQSLQLLKKPDDSVSTESTEAKTKTPLLETTNLNISTTEKINETNNTQYSYNDNESVSTTTTTANALNYTQQSNQYSYIPPYQYGNIENTYSQYLSSPWCYNTTNYSSYYSN